MTKIKTGINLTREAKKKGEERAKELKYSFSRYVEMLIDDDIKKHK